MEELTSHPSPTGTPSWAIHTHHLGYMFYSLITTPHGGPLASVLWARLSSNSVSMAPGVMGLSSQPTLDLDRKDRFTVTHNGPFFLNLSLPDPKHGRRCLQPVRLRLWE